MRQTNPRTRPGRRAGKALMVASVLSVSAAVSFAVPSAAPVAADHIPVGESHPLYPDELWFGDALGWGRFERRLGSHLSFWYTISPVPRQIAGALVIPGSSGSYLPYPTAYHPVPVWVNNTWLYWNPNVPNTHYNSWAGRNVNGTYQAGPFQTSCPFQNSCPGGHTTAAGGYTGFRYHRDALNFVYLAFAACGSRCDLGGGPPTPTTPPPTTPPPTTRPEPEIPPRPPVPRADRVEAALELTSGQFSAQGDFRHDGATVSSVRLICSSGRPCAGPGAPQLIGVYGTLEMAGSGGYRRCASMGSSGCDYFPTVADTSDRLRAGDQVLAAFFSPTGSGEAMRIQFRVTAVQVQTYRPELRRIYDTAGILISYEWVWVRDAVISVPVAFTPGLPLDVLVVGTVGG